MIEDIKVKDFNLLQKLYIRMTFHNNKRFKGNLIQQAKQFIRGLK